MLSGSHNLLVKDYSAACRHPRWPTNVCEPHVVHPGVAVRSGRGSGRVGGAPRREEGGDTADGLMRVAGAAA
jgi:hypothetical protein